MSIGLRSKLQTLQAYSAVYEIHSLYQDISLTASMPGNLKLQQTNWTYFIVGSYLEHWYLRHLLDFLWLHKGKVWTKSIFRACRQLRPKVPKTLYRYISCHMILPTTENRGVIPFGKNEGPENKYLFILQPKKEP